MVTSKKSLAGLTLGALGVVFGDIGTSPLYAVQAIFGVKGHQLGVTQNNVYGIISLILWSITLVVSIKYICFIMRGDNKGEGGIIALIALVKSSKMRKTYKWFFIILGLLGVALFYGDSAITPAISVLAAVENLKVVTPDLSSYVIPATVAILVYLFWIQKYGTAWIGRIFGPVMLVWFLTIGAGGVWQISQHPGILRTLSPASAAGFVIDNPLTALILMGVVILAVTGAEALYADMGHFGRGPIARAWFFLVFPALILCYMGQGALILNNPYATNTPFILMFPFAVRVPVLMLATLATFIASQSVISGAFSLTRQAIHLDFLPKMLVKHTSEREIGQVYIPFINAVLFAAVLTLVLVFGSSAKLANAYGLAVSGTLAIDTILFIVVARSLWRKSLSFVFAAVIGFLLVDAIFVISSLPKILKGGWFPILIASLVFLLIQTWLKGQHIASGERKVMEGSLQTFVDKIRSGKLKPARMAGQAVYIGHHANLAPLALHATVEEMHALHEKAVIVSVSTSTQAHVPEEERASFDDLGFDDGVSHLSLTYGFHDSINVPRSLQAARHLSPELDFDPETASYFVSISKVVPTHRRNLARWRKVLYALMYRNAMSSSDYYRLPIDRTIEIRSLIKL